MPSSNKRIADIQELRRPFPTHAGDLGLTVITYQGRLFQTGKPVRFYVRRGRRHSPVKGEPTGTYMLYSDLDEKKEAIVNLERPLVIDHGSLMRSGRWEMQLKNFFGGKRGPRITKGLNKKLRYDGIVTIYKSKPWQVLVFNTASLGAPISPKRLQARRAAKDLEKLFPLDLSKITVEWAPGSQEWVEEHELDQKDVIRLSGASGLQNPSNLKIDLNNTGLRMVAQSRWVATMGRSIRLENEKPYLHNDWLAILGAAPENLWVKLFYSQVLTSMKLMFDKIENFASRDSQANGYKHWPLLGYNALIRSMFNTEAEASSFVDTLKLQNVLKQDVMPTTASIMDLMRTKKGREEWAKNGFSFNASLSLNPLGVGRPSKSIQVLEKYLGKKANREGLRKNNWLTKTGTNDTSGLRERIIRLAYQRPELRPHLLPLLRTAQLTSDPLEEIPMTLEDESILDITWDELDEKWRKMELGR